MQAPSEALFLAQIVLLLLVGRLMGEAMQRIGQAAVMGQLIAGILLGPSVFGAIWPEAQRAVFAANPGSRTGGRARLGSERAWNGHISSGEFYARAASGLRHHPLDQRQFCQRSAGGHRNSRHHGHDGAHYAFDRCTYRTGCVRGRGSRWRVADPYPTHRRTIAGPRRRSVHAHLLFACRLACRLDHPWRTRPCFF